MPTLGKWTPGNGIWFEYPYYEELLEGKECGCLPRDLGAHALWHYYGHATISFDRAQRNIVEESELSLIFNDAIARNIFLSISKQYNQKPEHMVKFWDCIQRQRIALGLGQDPLPDQFKFKYWGH